MQSIPAALAPLAAFKQWILWMGVPGSKPGKLDKLPVNPVTGEVSNAHNPAIWMDAEGALRAAAALPGYGVGFVFTQNDPFFFLDVDNCLNDDGTTWSPLAVELCGQLAGAAVEVSQSGRGLHIIGRGNVAAHACKNTGLKIELYTSGRFVALTGAGAMGDAGHECLALPAVVDRYFPATGNTAGAMLDDWTDTPVPEWHGPEDDDDLIARACARVSAGTVFGGGKASFKELWERDVDALARSYPDDARPYDESSADAALAQHLAFWTGRNMERMLRIMRRSALVREKWERADYLPRTIRAAAKFGSSVYAGGAKPQEPAPEPVEPAAPMGDTASGPTLTTGLQFLAVTQQLDHFKGCVYVRDAHRILTPDGALLDQGQFRAVYGGYTFAVDNVNDKTTRNAWEAFVESQAVRYPKATATVFRPELAPGEIIEDEGYTLVNSYAPIETTAIEGDAGPFLGLLHKLLPDERDRRILLSYMAALVQNPGRKFQWWPVLQGAEGNGKTMIISALAHAVGHRYTHLPNTDDIARSGNKFNGWVSGKLFLGLEEIYVANRREFLEAFKTTVTNERISIERKGVDQTTGDNRANGVMCTNHREGVPVTVDTRRYCIFYTAQQTRADLERDGMTGRYFPDLYDWFKGRGDWAFMGANYGAAVINAFLRSYKVDAEFNPAGMCQRAPETSSTADAVAASLGGIEQEILEAIGEGRPGFAGGWVSSMMLDRLLESLRVARQVPPTKRRSMMQGLGYDWHPALKDGRVNNPVAPDNGKTRLFIKGGHIHANLTNPAAVAKAYTEAQAATYAALAVATFGG